jgi:competence CoiA-like predicted nuclease
MPFTAYRLNETGNRELVCVINRGRNDAPLGGKRFECPECGGVMAFRNPWRRRPHFYHLHRNDVAATCSLAAGETPEHEAGKYYVANDIARSWRYSGRIGKVIVEYPIGNRRADVVFEMKDGGLEVFEIQLAPITPVELAQRTEDYNAQGATAVHWFIGRDADTKENRTWIEDTNGECITINFRYETVTVALDI